MSLTIDYEAIGGSEADQIELYVRRTTFGVRLVTDMNVETFTRRWYGVQELSIIL